MPGFAINVPVKVPVNASREPKQKVVKISSQPGSRNSGKTGDKILCEKRTTRTESHEKMSSEI